MIVLIIYLVGMVFSYVAFKKMILRDRKFSPTLYSTPGEWGWDDVMIGIFASLFSWLGVVVGLVAIAVIWSSNTNTKPPKWL